MGATEQLASFVVNCKHDAISDAARQEMRRSLLDTLGTILAGTVDPAGILIADFVAAQSAGGSAWLAGREERTSPMLAALANGTMGHALDFDDGLLFGHAGVALVPTCLAVAEHVGASGNELLDALVLGIEVAGRIRMGMSTEPYHIGYHGTPVLGVFGATAAAGRLLGLDEQRMRYAFGIAGSLAAGVCANFGTMTKPLHAGECGRAAVEAAMLAQAGFTASPEILEISHGYGDTLLGKSGFDPARVVADLGVSPLIAERGTAMKKYPCCHANHAPIDGVFHIMAEHSLDPADVDAVHVTGAPIISEALLYVHPTSGLQGKFSMYYNIALTLVDGRVSLSSFTDEHVRDPRLTEVIDKVTVETVEGWEPWQKVRVEILTTKGARIVHDQEFVSGDELHPLDWATVVDKYRDNASVVLTEKAIGRTVDVAENLEGETSILPLVEALADRAPVTTG